MGSPSSKPDPSLLFVAVAVIFFLSAWAASFSAYAGSISPLRRQRRARRRANRWKHRIDDQWVPMVELAPDNSFQALGGRESSLPRQHAAAAIAPGGEQHDEKIKGARDGAYCRVVGGTHAGKSGAVRDIKTSKTHVTITVEQKDGAGFKTLAKSVVMQDRA